MSDWQPIETAPKNGTWILTWNSDESSPEQWAPYEVVMWWDEGFARDRPGGFYDRHLYRSFPTHWKPLEPPSGRLEPNDTFWNDDMVGGEGVEPPTVEIDDLARTG